MSTAGSSSGTCEIALPATENVPLALDYLDLNDLRDLAPLALAGRIIRSITSTFTALSRRSFLF